MVTKGRDATSAGRTRVLSDESAVTATSSEAGALRARCSSNESPPEREGDQGRKGERADQAQHGTDSREVWGPREDPALEEQPTCAEERQLRHAGWERDPVRCEGRGTGDTTAGPGEEGDWLGIRCFPQFVSSYRGVLGFGYFVLAR
jgi:hypothetical protein